MSTRNRSLILTAAALLTVSAAVAAPLPKLKAGDVLIQNTGSTNTTGYVIYVSPTGAVWYSGTGMVPAGQHFSSASLPKAQAQTLIRDLAAAGPLATLPARHGMRSASFGAATYLTYKGQHSPDLTFPANAQAQALRADINAIIQTLHLASGPRLRVMRPAALPTN